MLSYQHGYHAGNFADVHKHTALCLLLSELSQHKQMVTYIDTHSGSGHYDLSDLKAQKTGEWQDGIGRLLGNEPKSQGLALYLKSIKKFEEGSYPGSPSLMRHFMAPTHRAHFFDLHPQEFKFLEDLFKDDTNISTHFKDGTKAVFDYLPARKSKGLVLIDPSYEVKEDYETVASLAKQISKRWPEAIILVWYPVLIEARHEVLKSQLKTTQFFEMTAPHQKQRMLATGLGIINAPESFEQLFKVAEAEIIQVLKA